MCAFRSDIGENNTGGNVERSPRAREGKEMLLAQVWKAEEPKDGIGETVEDAEVKTEG